MSNLFDNTTAAHKVPRYIVKGDYIAWRNSEFVTDYPPASYTLSLNARAAGDSAGERVVTATEDSGEYLFEIVGADWTVGMWFYDLHITQDSDGKRATLKSGIIQVLADKAEDPDDPRSLPRRMVANLEALLEDRVLNRQIDTTSFDNGETSASRDITLIRGELRIWERKLKAAIRNDRARRGLSHGGKIRGRA